MALPCGIEVLPKRAGRGWFQTLRRADFCVTALRLVCGAAVASVLAAIFSCQASAEDLQFIDAHSPVPASVSMATVLSLMDRAGVARAFVASFDDPQSQLGRDARRNHQVELRDYAKQYPDRFTLTIGLKGTGNRDGDPAVLQLIQQQAASPGYGAQAEVIVVHAEKGPTLPEMIVDLYHRSVQDARAIALKRGWPLIIHIEFGHARTLGRYDDYMHGLETLLTENAALPVILSHMGQLKPAEVSRLISAHNNIYFLTSNSNPIVIAAKGKSHPWTDLFSSGAIVKDWEALMVAHPDRFVFAIDPAIKPDWSDRYVQQVELWRKALQKLPPAAAYAIARGNAERLWRLPGAAEPSSAMPALGAASAPSGGGELVGPRGLTAQQVISNSDRDGDGKVTREEFRGSPRNFQNLDTNRDGFVTREEFEAGWTRRLSERQNADTMETGSRRSSGAQVHASAAAVGQPIPVTNDLTSFSDNVTALLRRLIRSDYRSMTTIDGHQRDEPHNAVDIPGKKGDDVLAAADGKVIFSGNVNRGLAVIIAHGRNVDNRWYWTSYLHNSEILTKVGDTVHRGQVIALIGNTGTRAAPHLHFQVDSGATQSRRDAEQASDVDPALYWHVGSICFNPAVIYPTRPLKFTLPVRCP